MLPKNRVRGSRASIRSGGPPMRERRHREDVTLAPQARLGREHLRPSCLRRAGVAKRVRGRDEKHAVVARPERKDAVARLTNELAFEDVDALLERVNVRVDRSARHRARRY